MPGVMYWMSNSVGRHFADIALASTFALLCLVLWPLLSRVDGVKTSRQNKVWLAIAVVISCLALTLFVLYPKYLQVFA